MNRHWLVQLGDISSIVMGQAPPGTSCNKDGNGTVFVKAGEFGEREPVVREWTTKPLKMAQKGDVLVCVVGATAGKINIGIDSAIGRSVAAVRPASNKLDTNYLHHFLATKVQELRSRSQGLAQGVITREMLASLTLQLPPLDEQRRIAAILDKADALRQKRKRAIALLDSLTQSIFLEMFGVPGDPRSSATPQRPLGTIAQLINGDRSSNYPSGDDLVRAGVLFLNTSNITPTGLDLTGANYITEQKFASLTRGKLAKNDLIITLRGSLGQTAIFENAGDTGFINAQMMIIRPSDGLDSRYLLQALQLDSTVAQLKRIGSGSAVPQLTAKQMSGFLIPIPEIEQQQAFARKSAALNAERVRYVAQQNYSDSLFASLQHRAFSGQL